MLGQGEPLGRGRALARALGDGAGRHRPRPDRAGHAAFRARARPSRRNSPRCGCPARTIPNSREVRLDPLRSDLDGRREILLQRLLVCGVGYGEPIEVAGTGDGTALTTRWRLAWTPGRPGPARPGGRTRRDRGPGRRRHPAGDLPPGVRGRRAHLRADPRRAARRGPVRPARRWSPTASPTPPPCCPPAATLPELLDALDLLEALRRGHLPGTTAEGREPGRRTGRHLLEAAVRALPGLAGSDQPEDAAALVALASRAGEHRLGLRHGRRPGRPSRAPVRRSIQGAALAARVLLDLDGRRHPRRAGRRLDRHRHRPRRPPSRWPACSPACSAAPAPLLQSAPAALDPLLDRVDDLADQGFLDRLPALRGGFDTLTPAGRDRLLRHRDRTARRPARPGAGRLARAPGPVDRRRRGGPGARSAPCACRPAGSREVAHGRATAPPAGPCRPQEAATGAGHQDAESRDRRAASREPTPTARRRASLPGRPVAAAARPGDASGFRPDARRYAHALDELYGAGPGRGRRRPRPEATAGGGGRKPPSPPPASGPRSWTRCSAPTSARRCWPGRPTPGRTDVLGRARPRRRTPLGRAADLRAVPGRRPARAAAGQAAAAGTAAGRRAGQGARHPAAPRADRAGHPAPDPPPRRPARPAAHPAGQPRRTRAASTTAGPWSCRSGRCSAPGPARRPTGG